jgi:hypothetical protein
MKLKTLITPSAVLAAFTIAAVPSFAQEKYHGHQRESGQQSSGQQSSGQQSSGQSRERAQPRSESPRAQQQQQRQPQPQRQAEQPRAESRGYDNHGNDNRRAESRTNESRRYEGGRAVPRGDVYAPHYEPRYSPRYEPGYSPRSYSSRSYYRPYVFRPRLSIGFGIYAGYPVPYTYSYPYPIVVYGYRAPRERVMVTPGSPYYGGVALEMTPYDADVFVDGQYAGRVEDFDGTTQPLTLTAGRHQIEVQAEGFEPMRVDVDIQPGQVIPYRGDLRPY